MAIASKITQKDKTVFAFSTNKQLEQFLFQAICISKLYVARGFWQSTELLDE